MLLFALVPLLLLATPTRAWRMPVTRPAETRGPVATVPFHSTDLGQMLIDAQLSGAMGGAITGRFVFDTGAGSCLIAQSLADRLGLISQTAVGAGGQPLMAHGVPVRQVIVPYLSLGGLGFGHVPFLVFDDKTLHAMTGQTVDGFLGGNLCDTMAMLLDFAKHQVQFFDHGSLTPADLKAAGMELAPALPLTPVPDSRWYTCSVAMQNGDKATTQDLVVDTGCVTTVLTHDAAVQAGLTDPMGWRGHRQILTEAGDLTMSTVYLPMLTPGGPHGMETQHRTMVAYPEGALPADMAQTLGLNVLDHYRVLLDFPGQTLYLAANPPPDMAPPTVP
jgi:predicted aspartyl protease